MASIKDGEVAFIADEIEGDSRLGKRLRENDPGLTGNQKSPDYIDTSFQSETYSETNVGFGVSHRDEYLVGIAGEEERVAVSVFDDEVGVTYQSDEMYIGLQDDLLGVAVEQEDAGVSIAFDRNLLVGGKLAIPAASIRVGDMQFAINEKAISLQFQTDLADVSYNQGEGADINLHKKKLWSIVDRGFGTESVRDRINERVASSTQNLVRNTFGNIVAERFIDYTQNFELTSYFNKEHSQIGVVYQDPNQNVRIGYLYDMKDKDMPGIVEFTAEFEAGTLSVTTDIDGVNSHIGFSSSQIHHSGYSLEASVGYSDMEQLRFESRVGVEQKPFISFFSEPQSSLHGMEIRYEKKF